MLWQLTWVCLWHLPLHDAVWPTAAVCAGGWRLGLIRDLLLCPGTWPCGKMTGRLLQRWLLCETGNPGWQSCRLAARGFHLNPRFRRCWLLLPELSAPLETESCDNSVPAGAQVRVVWAGTGWAGDLLLVVSTWRAEEDKGSLCYCLVELPAQLGPSPAGCTDGQGRRALGPAWTAVCTAPRDTATRTWRICWAPAPG